jgi:hypothetical protein
MLAAGVIYSRSGFGRWEASGKTMLAAVRHILPLADIRFERRLRIPGKILVRKGQMVSASDTIAEATLAPQHYLLDVGRGLGIKTELAEAMITLKPGAQVTEGDLIAGPIGWMRRVVLAPVSGQVVLVGDGQVLLEVKKTPFELKAGIPGEVIELLDDQGVVIQASGALIQGVWGNGRMDFGLLHCLLTAPDQILSARQLNVSLRGLVVLAGICEDEETLKAAADLPLRGLILASMAPALIPYAMRLNIPVLLLEGFGHIPMDSAAFKLLSTQGQRDIALIAEPWDRFTGHRPQVVIPLPAPIDGIKPQDVATFTVGQRVRVNRAPYQGAIGTVRDLVGPVQLPNGIRAIAAEVQLESSVITLLPLANLEVLV